MLNVSPVWQANKDATENIIINQGGTDSGKTYAIMQLLFWYACTEPAPKIDAVITIVAESVPNLKKGAYRAAESIYQSTKFIQHQVTNWNKTDRIITFRKGWMIEFTSAVTEQAAKQGKRQFAFFNEANGISWPIFWQMAKRTRRQVFIDYNPSAPFWAHEKLIGTTPESNDLGASVKRIISDHRHNPFLSEDEHRRTENIKDPNLWRVYARGLTGNLQGLIYPNWKQIPDNQFPDTDYFWGLDFGYTNDETALTKCAVIGNNFFIHECLYETGAPARRVKEVLAVNGYTSKEVVYCDHDKEQIYQLRQLGIVAVPATKGNGSIKGGIMKIGEFNVFYTNSSKNIHEERIRYMWEKDPITGESTNQPKGGFDHALDSLRMALYTKFFRQGI